jgi:hypothetical protein
MSHNSDTAATASYGRLEFGDAILEIIVVTELLAYENELSHSLLHLYKTALVNGDYLSFLALKWKITQKQKDPKKDPCSDLVAEVESLFSLPLWRFMRHGMGCSPLARYSMRWSVDIHLSDAISCALSKVVWNTR